MSLSAPSQRSGTPSAPFLCAPVLEAPLRKPALLALEDGTLFRGESIGADGHAQGEVVFNTSITGYQEILTDPSYCRQIVTLTYPHIGNAGVNPGDEEAARIHASGLVVRDCPRLPSNWRSRQSLDDYLRERGILALAGIDTRRQQRVTLQVSVLSIRVR